MENLQHAFLLHQAHPPTTPTSPPAPGTPLMPNGPGEAHVVVVLPDTLEIVAVSSEDEAMEDFEGHLEEQDNLEEDEDIDEAVTEQQWD